MKAIIRKELADNFTSVRVLVLFALAFMATAYALIADYQGIRGAGSEGFVFLRLFTTQGALGSLADVFAIFIIPLMGISLGFDAINNERTNGTMSHVLSQPLYRDSVVNGKFLAALITVTIMIWTCVLLVAGYGLRMIGVPPSAEEIIRLFLYLAMAMIYGGFWIALAILLSMLFRKAGAALIFGIGLWLLFSIFLPFIAQNVAQYVSPVTDQNNQAQVLKAVSTQQTLMRLSPNTLFNEATQVLLHPVLVETQFGLVNALQSGQTQYMVASALTIGQSMLIIWAHIVTIIGLAILCFAITYILFMKQEIRAT